MNQAIKFVQNQLSFNETRLFTYAFETTSSNRKPFRYAYFRLSAKIQYFLGGAEERMIAVPGLSGVGKTTILAQLYFGFKSKFKKTNILYVSLDEVTGQYLSLREILTAYEEVLGTPFELLDDPVLLLLDETHLDAEWARSIKELHNKSTKVMTIFTGSSAILLEPQYEDLGRRLIVERVYPLSFSEFQMIKNKIFPVPELEPLLKQALYQSKTAEECLSKLESLQPLVEEAARRYNYDESEEYLRKGTMPFAVHNRNEGEVFLAIERIVDKMIYKDLPLLHAFKIEYLPTVKALLYLLAGANGEVAISKINDRLHIDRRTTQKIIDALISAEVLIEVRPYKAKNKPSKYYFMCPALRRAFLEITGLSDTEAVRRGLALEDLFALHFYREIISTRKGSVYFDSAAGGADFVLDLSSGARVVVEVGVGQKTCDQIESTMIKVKSAFGLIFCKTDKVGRIGDKNILRIPWKFILLM